MEMTGRIDSEPWRRTGIPISDSNVLSDLSRAATAFFDAAPECVEDARAVYFEALRVFKMEQSSSREISVARNLQSA
jgi:hypothetical protein